MGNVAKKKARQFCIEYRFMDSSKENIESVIRQIGYTIVEFSYIFNDEDVQNLIDALKISDDLTRSRGFTYASSNHRIVFLNEDLSDEEKRIVLTHELGHIYCKHFGYGTIIGTDVQDEHEANEFEHYILNIPNSTKAEIWFFNNIRIITIVTIVSLLLAIAVGVWVKKQYEEKRYYGEYYITETGTKYHEKDCMFVKDKTSVRRLTEEEFQSGNYEPCKTCLP